MSPAPTERSVPRPSLFRKPGKEVCFLRASQSPEGPAVCWGPAQPAFCLEHFLHLVWPWDCGCMAREAGRCLIFQTKLTTQANTPHSRETARSSGTGKQEPSCAHGLPDCHSSFTNGVLCWVGQSPSTSVGRPVRKGSHGSQEPAAQEVKMEGREPTGNVTETQRTHCHRQLLTLPKRCWQVTSHATVSAKEP